MIRCIWLKITLEEELDKFVESLDSKSFKKIQRFYETMPKLMHEIEVENPKTKVKSKITIIRSFRFFRVALSHDTLENHYQVNFSLMQHHKYSLTELNDMVPWEREIYVNMLIAYIKEEKEKRERERR